MGLIIQVKVKNFKSFRSQAKFDFADSTYLIGVNNAGKTNIFHAIRAFFDESYFADGSFINRTEFSRKQAGYNRSEITVTFNLDKLITKSRKNSLIKQYGNTLSVTKIITYMPDSNTLSVKWKLNDRESDDMPEEFRWLLSKIKITYIHPQEGKQLLSNVQKRLRQRLLANWGRGSALTHSIEDLKEKWIQMRQSANRYLSQSVSDSLQAFWPNSSVKIDLPKNIQDIISISDINFSGYKDAPEIELTSQGTGAQTTVLYLAHYLLDSDRSLNRGEYHPVWLMEEPESFLHADLLSKLSKQINSSDWQKNIQMIISTHSPILLATSRLAGDRVIWNILDDRKIGIINIANIDDDEIKNVGKLMGDPNFFAYFLAAQDKPLIFIEDKKSVTVGKYIESGIDVARGLNGVSEIGKFLEVFIAAPFIPNNKIYFIIDHDKGKDELARFYDIANPDKEKNGFSRFKVKNSKNIYLVILPSDFTSENLFLEFDNHLQECISKIWNMNTWKINSSIPTNLSSLGPLCRRKTIKSKDEAVSLIKNQEDVKSLFWEKVEKFNYQIGQSNTVVLKNLLN